MKFFSASLIFATIALCPKGICQGNNPLPAGRDLKNVKIEVPHDAKYQVGSCYQYFLHRPQSTFYLPKDGQSLYFISALRGRKFSIDKRYLLRFDFQTRQLFRKLTVPGKRNAALIPITDDLSDLVFLTFDHLDNCFAGQASGVGIRMQGGAIRDSLKNDQYFLTRVDEMPAVANLSSNSILSLGAVNFQKRRIVEYATGQWPLFYGTAANILVSLDFSGQTPVLLKSHVHPSKVLARIKLTERHKIVQSGDEFVIVVPVPQANDILIREIKGWAGSASARYRLTLPQSAPVADAYLEFDHNSKRVLVFAKNPLTSKRWSQVYVFDYRQNKLLGSFDLSKGHYVDLAAFQRNSQAAVFVIKDYSDQSIVALRQFRFGNNTWEPVHLEVY